VSRYNSARQMEAGQTGAGSGLADCVTCEVRNAEELVLILYVGRRTEGKCRRQGAPDSTRLHAGDRHRRTNA